MIKSNPFVAVLALIFLIRAMVPTGFMPDFSGAHAIQICSGAEMKTIMVDDHGNKVPSSDHNKSPCVFSFLAASFLDAPHVDLVAKPETYTVANAPDVQGRLTRLFSLSPQSRGPPAADAI